MTAENFPAQQMCCLLVNWSTGRFEYIFLNYYQFHKDCGAALVASSAQVFKFTLLHWESVQISQNPVHALRLFFVDLQFDCLQGLPEVQAAGKGDLAPIFFLDKQVLGQRHAFKREI